MARYQYLFLLLFLIILFSIKYYTNIENNILTFSNNTKTFFVDFKDKIEQKIKVHFDQRDQIVNLENKLKEIEPLASLSIAYASKLNALLTNVNLNAYTPTLHLIRTISYEKLHNYYRFWVDFNHFDKTKVYGLIHQGYTAGIVKEEKDKPLAILQNDKSCIFSVYIGDEKISGVLMGNEKNLTIEYIQRDKEPQIGDIVITSGHDNIFYEGIQVGKIINVQENQMYKTAFVEPFSKPLNAEFYYAIDIK